MGPSVAVPEAGHQARCRIVVEGVVQGVGFRPFVYRLAIAHRLSGAVRNGQHGVLIDAEGDREAIARFLDELQSTAPSLARLRHITVSWTTPHHDGELFRIDTSSGEGEPALFPAPDLAVCPSCLAEMGDPGNRRHDYPYPASEMIGDAPRTTPADVNRGVSGGAGVLVGPDGWDHYHSSLGMMVLGRL